MAYYPALIDLRGQVVLVVGGGHVARRKVEGLLGHGAQVRIVARELTPELDAYVKSGRIAFLGRDFSASHLEDAFAVIAATDEVATNRLVSEGARARGLLVNAVDQPSDCNFILPSVLRRGDLVIAVSTSGKSPALAKRIREGLEERFGEEYGLLLHLLGHLRKEVLSRALSQEEKRRIFERLVESPLLRALREEDWNSAAMIVEECMQMKFSAEDLMNYLKDR